jgi:dTDP-4-dehydrorhamnose reductase
VSERALVVGADGLIGSALAGALARAGTPALATTRRREHAGADRLFLDLADKPQKWPRLEEVSVAYLCAGATSVEKCERDPAGTARVNVAGTLALAQRLRALGAFVVFLSTNIVFDGSSARARATDEPSPRSEYGRQKLAVERGLLRAAPPAAVVRLTKVLGPKPPLFMGWLERLRAGRAVEPFADKVMAPVPLPFAVDALLRVGGKRLAGVTQVSGPEDASYADIARFLAKNAGVDSALVRPVAARGEKLAPALAPAHTALDTSRLQGELGMNPPDIWSTIAWSIS